MAEEQRQQLRGNWNQVKGKLKQQYGELTDEDLAYEEGQKEQLIGKIQEKTGKAREEIKETVDRLFSS